MLNKKLVTAAVGTALLAGVGATSVQAFDISGNVALTSDYRFRGISQTDKGAAVQGGFDAAFEPGIYIGTWASNVDFDNNDNATGSYGNIEVDYYAGWAGPIGDTDFAMNVGYAYYSYPEDTTDPKGDYGEFYIKPSWKDLIFSIYYSDDNYAETGESFYYAGDYTYSFLEDFALGLHVGYSDFENDKASTFLSNDQDSYTDYSVSLTYSVFGVDLSVAYVGTDLDEVDYFDTDLAEDVAVFTIKKVM
jgi:uncharacterized protein (TIGR02001 family)